MTFWSLTNSDFPTNQTFHQFHDLDTGLDLHRLWVVSMEHLQRVWHASRERLPFRTPGSVPYFGTCWCSNCWDQIPRTCHVFTRLFTSNTPWYFLDFACLVFIACVVFVEGEHSCFRWTCREGPVYFHTLVFKDTINKSMWEVPLDAMQFFKYITLSALNSSTASSAFVVRY